MDMTRLKKIVYGYHEAASGFCKCLRKSVYYARSEKNHEE